METANRILDYFGSITPTEAFFWLFIQNILQFVLCIGGGLLLIKLFSKKRIYEAPDLLSKKELLLAAGCVFFNSVVAFGGWLLWQEKVIVITRELDWTCLADTAILLLLMDLLMYITHRIVHIKGIYALVHRTHHIYENTRPLSLFVLSPLEVFGFGALWLLVLSFYSSSWLGIVLYLLLNASFGALGHIGVEPFPKSWIKIPLVQRLTTSTFHAQHHKEIDSNFGFYTDIWDRLFGSLNKAYQATFEQAASKG